MKRLILLFVVACIGAPVFAQGIQWDPSGKAYYKAEKGEIVKYVLPTQDREVIVSTKMLTPSGSSEPLTINGYSFSSDGSKVIVFTNTKKVWRFNTRGDYWIVNLSDGSLRQLGKSRPVSTLMFAKISPDGKYAAYVSEYNLYAEDLKSGNIKALTKGGHRKLINGTFDWAYEEEFFCKDGFRWSPDSKKIAYWQVDARGVRDHYMINNTDSIYPKIIPVEYPVAGERPSPAKIGVVEISTGSTRWLNMPEDPLGYYIPVMEWQPQSNCVTALWLSRRQNEVRLFSFEGHDMTRKEILAEKDSAWIEINGIGEASYEQTRLNWLNNGAQILWPSEKNGWRHLFVVNTKDGSEKEITKGNYDVIDLSAIDEQSGYVYFLASPKNATQKYLYRVALDGSSAAPERITPSDQNGWNTYNLSPNALFGTHSFSNHKTPPVSEWIHVAGHQTMKGTAVADALKRSATVNSNIEFFTVKNREGVEMDAWMVKPQNFDPSKKYPVVFFVYTEYASQNVQDKYGAGYNFMYRGNMAADGYVYVSIDNRGTPVPKGSLYRKSIYRKIGQVNINDQADAARQILQWPFIDTARVAVWGWSGGGTATLNLMFQYPEIYKTGIGVSAVDNGLTYDNIYQERFMGLPQEAMQDYIKGSPITHAKNLKGNLLYIHGTGDDNVHYNNAEMLLNELIKHNKQFQFMPYPNRTHEISEGEGTRLHLYTMYTNFLKAHCPPGGK